MSIDITKIEPTASNAATTAIATAQLINNSVSQKGIPRVALKLGSNVTNLISFAVIKKAVAKVKKVPAIKGISRGRSAQPAGLKISFQPTG